MSCVARDSPIKLSSDVHEFSKCASKDSIVYIYIYIVYRQYTSTYVYVGACTSVVELSNEIMISLSTANDYQDMNHFQYVLI